MVPQCGHSAPQLWPLATAECNILVVTFFWGLFAHAYCFFDNSFSHDSLVELRADFTSNYTKLTVGRVLTPVYRAVFRGNLTLPWFCGCLALLWTSAAVWLMTKMLNIQSKVTAFFLAGIMTANITFAAIAATFMHDLDCYMFAMLCSTGATWMWQQGRPIFFLGG